MENLTKYLFLLFGLTWNVTFGQGVSADFQIDDGCREQNLIVNNSSSGGDSFSWDFCADDFSNLKTFEVVAPIGSSYGTSFKLVEDNGQWFGFGTFWYGGSQLVRFDFGDSPLNTPSVVPLGNPGGGLVFAESIDIIKVNGVWYGLVTNIDVGANIILLDFGTDLRTSPQSKSLGNYGLNDRLFDVRIIVQGSDVIVAFAQFITKKITFLNFGSTFPDNTAPAITDFVISNAQFISGFDLFEANEGWKAVILSYNDNKLLLLDFSGGLSSTPIIVGTFDSVVDKPYRIRTVKNIGKYYVVVSGETNADVKIFDFFDFSSTPEVLPLTGINQVLGFDLIKNEGKIRMVAAGTTTNLNHAIFESECGANIGFSYDEIPQGLTYSSGGLKDIELVVSESTDNSTTSITKQISISEAVSPFVSFTNENICIESDIHFNSSGDLGDIATFIWDFGDNTVSSDINPYHKYAIAGTYNINLKIVAVNGCENNAGNTVKIYDKPFTDFNLPTPPFCTNTNFYFENLTNDHYDGFLSYEWLVNEIPVTMERDLNYTFINPGEHTLKMVASIPGCSSSKEIILENIGIGPEVDFTLDGVCDNQIITFINSSQGEIDHFEWSIGEIEQTQIASPSLLMPAGIHTVTLTAYGTNECVSVLSNDVIIYAKPLVDFSIASPILCYGYDILFNDESSSTEQLASWNWKFGMEGESNLQNPKFKFLKTGDFSIELQVTDEHGCTDSKIETINVLPVPDPVITHSDACLNNSVIFSASSTIPIGSLNWNIASKSYTTLEPQHVFRNPGDYNVFLTSTALNGCVKKDTVIIHVFPEVIPEFSIEKNCVGEMAAFMDLTTSEDQIVFREWKIENNTYSSPVVNHQFTIEQSEPITLKVKTNSGCMYESTKQIQVVGHPIADFSSSSALGSPGMPFSFTNTSANASNYYWSFGDETNSSDQSPVHSFESINNFTVSLTASNEQGCKDEISKTIIVSKAAPDVNILSVDIAENPDKSYSVSLLLENAGNTILENLKINIDVSDAIVLSETINDPLQPQSRYVYNLNTAFNKNESLTFICAIANLPNDVTLKNNRNCASIESTQEQVFSTYPNPLKDILNIEWLAKKDQMVKVKILNNVGNEVLSTTFVSEDGLNSQSIDMTSMQGGIYLMSFEGETRVYTQRILLIH